MQMWKNIRDFFAPFLDPRALTWIIGCAAVMLMIDPVMFSTVLVWVIQVALFIGAAVIASRHIFPQIVLADFVGEAKKGNVAAGLVVLSVAMIVVGVMVTFAIFGRV